VGERDDAGDGDGDDLTSCRVKPLAAGRDRDETLSIELLIP
jgi:hypothetical protein